MKLKHKIGAWLMQDELKKMGESLPFVARWLSGKPMWTDWSTEKAIKDGLKASVWVYRCINRRAKAIASVPWYVEEWTGDGWERVPNHPIEVLLAEPNPFMSGQKLMEYMVNHLDLGGNAIWHIVMVQGMPVEFWPIIPDTKIIKPVPDRQNFLSHYEFTVEPGDVKKLDPREVIHFRNVDPSNLYWGLAPLQVAAKVVDTDVQAVEWNKVSLQNRAVTDGVFSFEHPLTQTQWEDARKQVREQHQGAENARNPWVLGGGAKWNQMSLSPVEMDFLNSRKFGREEICAVFDVPSLLVGATDASTYNNYSTARKMFWEDTVAPLLDDIREILDMSLVPFWDPEALKPGKQAKIRVMYDLSTVPAFKEDLTVMVNNARTLWQMGIPLNMINQRLELGFEDIPGGDKPRAQGGFMFASNDGPQSSKKTPYFLGENQQYKIINTKSSSWSEEQKAEFWKTQDKTKIAWEQEIAKKVASLFAGEGEVVAEGFKANGKIGASAAIDDMLSEWEDLLTASYTAVIEHFGQLSGEQIEFIAEKSSTGPSSRKFNFDPFAELIRKFIMTEVAKKVTYMTETTKQLIAQQIDEGFANGDSMPGIATRILESYKSWSSVGDSDVGWSRAMMIARTETASASGYGNHYGALQAEQEFGVTIIKTWISSRDDRVRDRHDEMDGETVPLNEPYSNGLMYPGDPNGSADEVIGCRCVEAHGVV